MLKQQGRYYIPELENMVVDESVLDAFDVERIELIALLWQTGYLTIEEEISDIEGTYYRLGIPNYEVRMSLNREFLFNYLKAVEPREIIDYGRSIRKAMESKDVDMFINIIKSLFAGIPYSNIKLSRYEDYYKSVIYAFFMGAGLEVQAEDITDKGRIDLTVKLPIIYKRESPLFIIELKVVKEKEGKALKQIKEKLVLIQ